VAGELLTKRETAELLRISLRTLDARLKEPNFLMPIRVTPGRVLFRKSAVLALIRRKSATPPPGPVRAASTAT
jgi:predicted DNA-binding transcriptional regulator AlpA